MKSSTQSALRMKEVTLLCPCNPYPYILVTRGDKELVDSEVYAVAFLNKGYTEKVSQKNLAEIHDGSLLDFLRIWLVEQKRVSPDGNPWE